jgi:CheY-like chemotaxis protein
MRCVHLKLAKFQSALPDDYLLHIESAIRNSCLDEHVQIYNCSDSDVFIITPYFTIRSLAMVLSYPSLNQLLPVPVREQADIYEIGFDNGNLKRMVRKKLYLLSQKKRFLQNHTEQTNKRKPTRRPLSTSIAQKIKTKRYQRNDPCVLLIEDDAFTHKLIKRTIGADIKIFSAFDANQGAALYLDCAPDIVFLDIGLPDLCGHDVLLQLQEMDCEAYIVMLSSHNNQENIERAISLGADGFIAKPFTKGKIEFYMNRSPQIKNKLKECV